MQATDGTRLSYAYDEHNNIQSYTAKKNGTTLSSASYTYSDDGLPVTAILGGENGTTLTYAYDTLNRTEKVSVEAASGNIFETEYYYADGTSGQTTGLVEWVDYNIRFYNAPGSYSTYSLQASDEYTYDKNGNITAIENSWGDRTYVYDDLNRLVRENDGLLDQTVVYTYDNGGNILTKTYYDYTTGTLGTPTDTIVYTYDTVWKDKLLTYDGGSTITYDAIGNPLTYNGFTFTWQKGRQLASASGNGKTISYKYGADGLRTEKTVNGTTTEYTYASGLLVSQTSGTNTLNFSYTADGVPRTVHFNNTPYYYIYNLQGDVQRIVTDAGVVAVEYEYDTWGKLISTTGSLAFTLGALNPFRYRGYVYDTETGFYYLTTRYYDPDTGRFLNADGYISTGYAITGHNMYAYCLNDPVNLIDSNGDDPTPGWAQRINNGTATHEDYLEALNADPSAWAGLARSNVDRAIKTAKNKNPGTTTIGFTVSGAWGVGGTVSFGITYDNWGNVGVIVSGGGVGGTPSVGVDKFITTTNAPDISRLNGESVIFGGSGSFEGITIGGEGSVFLDKYTSDIYLGGTVSSGISLPIPLEFHAGVTTSKVYSFNLFKVSKKLIEIIWDGE